MKLANSNSRAEKAEAAVTQHQQSGADMNLQLVKAQAETAQLRQDFECVPSSHCLLATVLPMACRSCLHLRACGANDLSAAFDECIWHAHSCLTNRVGE